MTMSPTRGDGDSVADDRGRTFFASAMIVGLIVRIFTLWQTSTLGVPIVDEQHYTQLAANLLAGNGFGWGPGQLTSIRPPLYPGLVAAVWWVFGANNLFAVRVVQILLALGTTWVVYVLGTRAYGTAVARVGAAISWLYPSLVFFNFLMLTETLFTFLLMAFLLASVILVQKPRPSMALVCGLTLGLSALTRSVLWPLPILFCPLLLVLFRERLKTRVRLAALVLIGYTVVVAPWAIRNTRLQEVVTIVDTMGGINLRMGNYEYTPDDRMWDAVSIQGERSWVYGFTTDVPDQRPTEGRKDKWAQRKAIEYIKAHPGETMRRAFIKFADLWGLEREFVAGVQAGFYHPPPGVDIAGTLMIVLGYVIVVVTGAAGLWLAPPADWRIQVLLLVPIGVIVAGHTIVFGHSRYHVPLIPIFGLYASALVLTRRRELVVTSRPLLFAAAATITVFLAIWIRQVVVTDLARIGALFQ
jgi:4-amino-4-deoxy-L-arabinose transferase-like glycosyltransferase